ncbi:hypothetical protein HPB48_025596 [Haemaphysalis longicornis]|uniref:Uncharacterized protein n=1 Tax=Haemaphysalis longicornis TaxID=44386 RepID=A0A9J6H9U7_HAELO|nr:hypothetical protein HPB48_025596 [Haemaphysalis longicornis]
MSSQNDPLSGGDPPPSAATAQQRPISRSCLLLPCSVVVIAVDAHVGTRLPEPSRSDGGSPTPGAVIALPELTSPTPSTRLDQSKNGQRKFFNTRHSAHGPVIDFRTWQDGNDMGLLITAVHQFLRGACDCAVLLLPISFVEEKLDHFE